jgi:hypothetical protein
VNALVRRSERFNAPADRRVLEPITEQALGDSVLRRI